MTPKSVFGSCVVVVVEVAVVVVVGAVVVVLVVVVVSVVEGIKSTSSVCMAPSITSSSDT